MGGYTILYKSKFREFKSASQLNYIYFWFSLLARSDRTFGKIVTSMKNMPQKWHNSLILNHYPLGSNKSLWFGFAKPSKDFARCWRTSENGSGRAPHSRFGILLASNVLYFILIVHLTCRFQLKLSMGSLCSTLYRDVHSDYDRLVCVCGGGD